MRAGQLGVALVLVALLLRSASPARLWDRPRARGAVAPSAGLRARPGHRPVHPAQAGEALLSLLFTRAGVDGGETTAALIVQLVVGFAPEQILGACLAGRLLTVALLGSFTPIYSATRWRQDPVG